MNWLSELWASFLDWLDSWRPCPKEEMGYTCHHRILSNGVKECGEEEERNYWKGDDA